MTFSAISSRTIKTDEEFNCNSGSFQNNLLHLSSYLAVEFVEPSKKKVGRDYIDIKLKDNAKTVAVKVDDLARVLGLKSEDLKSIINKNGLFNAIEHVSSRISKLVFEAKQKVKEVTSLVSDGSYSLLVYKHHGEIHYIRFDNKKYLGKGEEGYVFKVYNMGKQCFEALKVTKKTDSDNNDISKETARGMQQEDAIFRIVYGSRPPGSHLTGLQCRPSPIIFFPLECQEKDYRFSNIARLMPLYNASDLDSIDKDKQKLLQKDWKIHACYQLLIGAAYLERFGIWHRDLCSYNTLVNMNDDGYIQIDLADFSSAVSCQDLSEEERDDGFSCHRSYVSNTDYNNLSLVTSDPDLFKKLALKMNAFAIGRILYDLFTDHADAPYNLTSEEYADTSKGVKLDQIKYTGYDDVIKGLINGLLVDDYNNRLSASTALYQFHQFMSKSSSPIAKTFSDEINAMIKK